MKKKLSLFLALAFMLALLSGCGQSSSPAAGSGAAEAPAAAGEADPAPAAPAGEVVTVNYVSNSAEIHPLNIITGSHWLNYWDEGSDTVEVKYYYNAELGTQTEMIEALSLGEPYIMTTDGSMLAAYAPDISVITAPFLFTDTNDYALVPQTDWWQEQCDILYQHGIKVVNGSIIYGSRCIVGDRAVRSPADLAGMKVRVPSNDIAINMMNLMGGVATPMDSSELYNAMSSGIVNGGENTVPGMYESQLQEVGKYLSMTNHQTFCTLTIMSAALWDSLSPADQESLIALGEEAAAYYNGTLLPEQEVVARQAFLDAGVEIVEDVDADAFQAAVAPLYDGVIETWSAGLAERVRAEVAAIK